MVPDPVVPDPVVPDAVRWGTEVVRAQVPGHPCLTFEQRVRDIRDLAIDARRFPERDYLVQGKRRVTFADHEAAVCSVAAALREHGVQPGDRVMGRFRAEANNGSCVTRGFRAREHSTPLGNPEILNNSGSAAALRGVGQAGVASRWSTARCAS